MSGGRIDVKPLGYAKGGRVKPPSLMGLRKRISQLMSDAAVEGTGKELVPVDPLTPGSAEVPSTGKGAEFTEEQLEKIARGLSEPNPLESIANMPVSRRTILEGLASMALPVDPGSIALGEIEKAVRAAPVATKVAPMSKAALARALAEIFQTAVHSSEESGLLDAANLADAIPGTESVGLGRRLREWHSALDEFNSGVEPGTSLEDRYYDFLDQIQEFGRQQGLTVIPGHDPREFGQDAIDFETPTDPAFVEPPTLGMKDRVQEIITAIRSGQTDLAPEQADRLQQWLDDLGDRVDAVFASHWAPGASEGSMPHNSEVLEKYHLDETVLDYLDDMFEDTEMPRDLSDWASVDPSKREEHRKLTEVIRRYPFGEADTPEGQAEFDTARERMDALLDEITPDHEELRAELRVLHKQLKQALKRKANDEEIDRIGERISEIQNILPE